mmetsp:Transcript_11045/g.25949  ORF Transcript_11045/g.25949 Transcript_11045/m.25949 type:complete len:233 (+) Transcript_11045:604-1302(+)
MPPTEQPHARAPLEPRAPAIEPPPPPAVRAWLWLQCAPARPCRCAPAVHAWSPHVPRHPSVLVPLALLAPSQLTVLATGLATHERHTACRGPAYPLACTCGQDSLSLLLLFAAQLLPMLRPPPPPSPSLPPVSVSMWLSCPWLSWSLSPPNLKSSPSVLSPRLTPQSAMLRRPWGLWRVRRRQSCARAALPATSRSSWRAAAPGRRALPSCTSACQQSPAEDHCESPTQRIP